MKNIYSEKLFYASLKKNITTITITPMKMPRQK